MTMLTISEEVLSMLVTNKVDPVQVVQNLAVHHPDILLKMLHIDDLIYHVQQAYSNGKNKQGNKVSAIKKYRELTGTDLKTSKLAVEAMEANGSIKVIPPDTYDDDSERVPDPYAYNSPDTSD